jgi:hypothetical protein
MARMPLAPFLLYSSLGSLLWTAALAAAGYLLATGAEAVRVGRRAGVAAIPLVWAIFPTLHVSHGVGFAAGLLRYLRDPDWGPLEMLPANDPRRAHLRVV